MNGNMNILNSLILYTVSLIVQISDCQNSLDSHNKPASLSATLKLGSNAEMYEPYPRKKGLKSFRRRPWPVNNNLDYNMYLGRFRRVYEDEKDANIKIKVATLMQQTMHDIDQKMKDIDYIRDKYLKEPTYKVGFIVSLVKKSRDVLNELFDVAIKHRDEWKTLDQLKIFELVMHTNVDITNYVKNLKDIQEQAVVNNDDTSNITAFGGEIHKANPLSVADNK